MNTRNSIIVGICFIIASCGGGSSGNGESPISAVVPDTSSTACQQEFFQTIIGRYQGTVEYAVREEVYCIWDLTMNVQGGSLGPSCVLNAETAGTVSQLVFSDNDETFPIQCLDVSGTRRVRENISGTVLPGEEGNLDNSHFPIDVNIDRLSDIDRGPYFGDESRTASFRQLFDGQTLINDVVVLGDGTISLRGGGLALTSGILVKEE